MYSKAFRKTRTFLYLTLVMSLSSLAPSAIAQAVYGSIFGTIADNTGAVIPNATITVTDVAKGTSVTAQSHGSGNYRVQHLIPDTYRVDVEARGVPTTLAGGLTEPTAAAIMTDVNKVLQLS